MLTYYKWRIQTVILLWKNLKYSKWKGINKRLWHDNHNIISSRCDESRAQSDKITSDKDNGQETRNYKLTIQYHFLNDDVKDRDVDDQSLDEAESNWHSHPTENNETRVPNRMNKDKSPQEALNSNITFCVEHMCLQLNRKTYITLYLD